MRREQGRAMPRLLMGVAAALFVLAACDGQETPATDRPPATTTMEANAEAIASGFIEAFGAFDVDGAIGYLAEEADITAILIGTASVEGPEEELRLNLSMLQAQAYEQRVDPCEETGTSISGTSVRCPFDFHLFGSDEIGRGPYGGSYFDLTVRDGQIVRGSVSYEIERFSPEMWEPFAEWVSTTHPDDAAVMYTDGTYSGVRISEESIRLWERHIRGYVEAVDR
jgi:hypothetical protein